MIVPASSESAQFLLLHLEVGPRSARGFSEIEVDYRAGDRSYVTRTLMAFRAAPGWCT